MQKNWREHILNKFTPQLARLTLVADPDSLVVEEGILQGLRERGFELLPFHDHVAFRFIYESRYRASWDNGGSTELIVVVNDEVQMLSMLPYDLLQVGRKLAFSLGDLFPRLSYNIVKLLDRSDLDALYYAYSHQQPAGPLGDTATKDFLLRQVFDMSAETVRGPADLLRILLRHYYRGQRIPEELYSHFIQLLRQHSLFKTWPLEKIVPNKEAFLSFLQERWPLFVQRFIGDPRSLIHEASATFSMGPSELPFEHQDVRVYIDTLFLDGLLHPLVLSEASMSALPLEKQWVLVGIQNNRESGRVQRTEKLLHSLEDALPGRECKYQDWLNFARRWAELLVRWHELKAPRPAAIEQLFTAIRKKIDDNFCAWIMQRYAALANLPAIVPVMLHHIPTAIAYQTHNVRTEKVALLVMDGMAFDQWIILKEELVQQRPDLSYAEDAVFAWLPTITSVSRQSIFAGKPPLYYPESIASTSKEELLWQQFWDDKAVDKAEVAYKRSINDAEQLVEIEELLSIPRLRVIGLVVDKIDRISHGMEMGTAGMHSQVRQWVQEGFLAQLIELLLAHNFSIYVTSDHGNIEARGCGSPGEGALAEIRGQRVRVYTDAALRERVQKRFPGAIAWPGPGLPADYLALFAPARRAFVREGEKLVGHGGITIEEIIVPSIHIKRK